ncbi:hypothetical protein DYB34_007665, partial [Aphanomyces astaci]
PLEKAAITHWPSGVASMDVTGSSVEKHMDLKLDETADRALGLAIADFEVSFDNEEEAAGEEAGGGGDVRLIGAAAGG